MLNLCETKVSSNFNDSNTLSNILQQYGDSVNHGEGFGYISLEWKGPFSLNNVILQHIRRIQLLIGKQPSLIYGVLPHINYGYVGLENILYIFPFNELNKSLDSTTLENSFDFDVNKKTRNILFSNDLNNINELNDDNILTLSFPFSISTLSGTFPRFGIFSEDVEYLLCVITEKSIHLLALKLDKSKLETKIGIKNSLSDDLTETFKSNDNVNFLNSEENLIIRGAGLIKVPIMRIGDKDISMLQCSLPNKYYTSKFHSLCGTIDGRFFFLEMNSSNIYEFVYQSKEGWITPYCYIYSHQLYSSLFKELLLKYTILRFIPRALSFEKISIAPCGYMAILDSYQNIYIVTYLNNVSSEGILPLLVPWGRLVNSLGKWLSNINIKTHFLPSNWDDYVAISYDTIEKNIKDAKFGFKHFSSELFLKKNLSKFSSPSLFKVVATLKKNELNEILLKLTKNSSKNKIISDYENLISNIILSFNSDYNLTLSVFMENGTRLQFQCSKKLNEEIPSVDKIINGFKNEHINYEFCKKRITQTTEINSININIPNNDLIFGFWLTFVSPLSALKDKKMSIVTSYYKNGLTILTRNSIPSIVKNANSNTDFSITSNKNICQIEIRLFNSLPADININSSHINNVNLNNSINLRYKSNSSLNLNPDSSNGEPILIELDENIKSIHEVRLDYISNYKILEDFPIIANSKNLILPHVILEYGGNFCGSSKAYDLLGWVNDRYIVLIGETRYFFLLLRWNSLQQIVGASGLFMQLMQNSPIVNDNSVIFRRLIHPEDSFLTSDCLSLTSPWIEALSGAVAFSLKSVLELPLFLKFEQEYNLIINPCTLEICFLKLQGLMSILMRSQNIIGSECFNPESLPNNLLNIKKSIHEILFEEFSKDLSLKLKESTNFILKSITYIVNILLQLIRFLIVFISFPNDIKKLTFKFFDEYNQNILTEMPLIFLIVSNRGVSQIKLFIESFSLSILQNISKNLNMNPHFILQIKLIYGKINWLLTEKANDIFKRISLFCDMCVYFNDSSNYIGYKSDIIERITSKGRPIGGFLFSPHKYWEIFQSDPTQNEFFKEIFSALSLKPFSRISDSTLLLLDIISYFEFLMNERIKVKNGCSNYSKESSFHEDYNAYFEYIEQIIRAWTFSLSKTFSELMKESSYDKISSIKSIFIKLSTQAITTLLSSCSNIKLIKVCIKYFFQDILVLIFEEYCNALNEKEHCICHILLRDFQETMRYEKTQKIDDSQKPLLLLINDVFKSSLTYIRLENHKNNLNSDFYKFINDFIVQENYSLYYFILSTLYLFDKQINSLANINCASVLSNLALNNNINCGIHCKNIQVRIDLLKLLQELCFTMEYSNSIEIDILKYFPQLFDENVFGNIQYRMDFSLENVIYNSNLIISFLVNLQVPFLNYVKKLSINNFNSKELNYIENFNTQEVSEEIFFKKIICSLSRKIYSPSELLVIINNCSNVEPFSIISTLFETKTTLLHNKQDSEMICSLISDILLQLLLPPKQHIIYSHFLDKNQKVIFPILTYFFGFNGETNYSESIRQLFEFIEKPILSITGYTFLASLAVIPHSCLTPNFSNKEIIEKYDLFQQIYSITAILEFGNFCLLNHTSKNHNQLPNSISIQLWHENWSIPYDLLLDIYLSLLESCLSLNQLSNPYKLIIERINSLNSSANHSEVLSLKVNSFVIHIRKCITAIIISWLNNKGDCKFNSNHSLMIKNFIYTSINQLQNEDQNKFSNFIKTLKDIEMMLQT